MAVRVVFRHQATADIEDIADTIGKDSPRQAVLWSEDMQARCLQLTEFPERAPIYARDIRRLVVGAYLVFYRIADPDIPNLRRVIVIRVLHSARNVDDLIDPDK